MEFYELIGFQNPSDEPSGGGTDCPDLARAVVFLDFDGTLVDLAATPDGVTVSPRIAAVLDDLLARTRGGVAIVSGRCMDDLRRFLPGYTGDLVGSHGAEWLDEAGEVRRHPAAEGPEFAQLVSMVRVYAERNAAILVEEKPCSIVLHFRQAPDALPDAERFLSVLVDQCPGFTLHHAKMALEVMPELVSKRLACERLLERFAGRRPIAFGDDVTDEGMLALAVDRGGLGFKVGEGHTAGNRRLADPGEVLSLLEAWTRDGTA